MKGVFEKKNNFDFFEKYIKGFRGFPPMFHPHVEILFVTKGEVNMTIDGHHLTVKPYELAMAYPYVLHSYESSSDAELYIIMFEPKTIPAFEEVLLSKKPVYPYVSNCERLLPLFKRIHELRTESNILKVKTAISYFSALVGELMCSMSLCNIEPVSEDMIKTVLIYCTEHFADDDISIKKISDELYISTSYVSKIFSSKLKYHFREYINELRISKAKDLLSKTDMKIIDVMLECGFKNQSSFNRIFFEICGNSPSEYRAKKRSQNK